MKEANPESGKPEPVHPFSIPLEKGGEPEKTGEPAPEAKTLSPLTPSAPATVHARLKMWQVFLAILAFPILFHGGTELYMFARVALVSYLGMGGVSSQQSSAQVPGMTMNKEDKILESLATIIQNQQKILEEGGQKVIVIRPEYPGSYSYDTEKNRIFQLSGIDMDDPISGTEQFKKIQSVEVLTALIESFDRIALNAAQVGSSDFHVKNAIEGKRQALKRLQELK
ncbi:MAG: hypothetical protein HZA04_10175 [Nitrospinae bacterium]|nr:hypothetical protein [Nitrospinota bacterium]